jgi:cytochrome c553
MMKLQSVILSVILAGAAPAVLAYKGDAEAGKTKAAAICAACHGADGNSTIPVNPSLAGQNYSYLAQALKDYRTGARSNPIMNGQAAGLTDEDIENLAKYFSSQTGNLVSMPAK